MIVTAGKIGQTYLFLENCKKSIFYFDKSYNLAVNYKDSLDYLSFVFNCYSVYYNQIGDNQLSLDYISKSIKYSQKNETNHHKYLTIGEIYNSFQQYDSARYYLSKSVTSDNVYTRTISYSNLYELEKSQGNLEEAIEYLVEYQEGVDSIIENSHKSETEKLVYKYNVEKAILEVNAKNKITIITLITIFIVLALFMLIYSILKDKKRKLLEKEKEKKYCIIKLRF